MLALRQNQVVPNNEDPLTDSELKALKIIWYEKLEKNGFEEIEDTNSPREFLKTWHSNYFVNRYTAEEIEDRQGYYRLAGQFLHDYPFEDQIEKEVWRLHSEGLSYRQIGKTMNMMAISRGKKSVFKIINKYRVIMKTYGV